MFRFHKMQEAVLRWSDSYRFGIGRNRSVSILSRSVILKHTDTRLSQTGMREACGNLFLGWLELLRKGINRGFIRSGRYFQVSKVVSTAT